MVCQIKTVHRQSMQLTTLAVLKLQQARLLTEHLGVKDRSSNARYLTALRKFCQKQCYVAVCYNPKGRLFHIAVQCSYRSIQSLTTTSPKPVPHSQTTRKTPIVFPFSLLQSLTLPTYRCPYPPIRARGVHLAERQDAPGRPHHPRTTPTHCSLRTQTSGRKMMMRPHSLEGVGV
jgi:hypothetical protein